MVMLYFSLNYMIWDSYLGVFMSLTHIHTLTNKSTNQDRNSDYQTILSIEKEDIFLSQIWNWLLWKQGIKLGTQKEVFKEIQTNGTENSKINLVIYWSLLKWSLTRMTKYIIKKGQCLPHTVLGKVNPHEKLILDP